MSPRTTLQIPDYDFVAVPLPRTELELLVGLWESSDEMNHEELSIDLKARGALAHLHDLHNGKAPE